MEWFPFIMTCLKDFNYPKIHSMNDLEVTDIFSKANRHFLVAWILKQIDEDYWDVVEDASKEDLACIVYSNGFCLSSEKNAFMNGECDGEKQSEILYKMFKFLKSVSPPSKNSEDNKGVSSNEIEDYIHFNLNLFPMYGAKKTLTATDYVEKINHYREEIAHLKNAIKTQTQTNSQDKTAIDSSVKPQLTAAVSHLLTIFPDFQRKALDLNKNRQVEAEKLYSDDFSATLQSCEQNVKDVLEFIKSTNVVMGFKENASGLENVEYDNRMVREFAELCVEVAALKREASLG